MLDQAAVAHEVFQLGHKHELNEQDRVKRGLAGVAVKRAFPRRETTS